MQQILNRKIKIPFSRPTKAINHSFPPELEEWSRRLERWLSYFKQNKERERSIDWQLPPEECQLPEEKQKALAYLLDQFGHAEEFEEYSGKQLAQGYHPLLFREAKSLGTPSQSQGTHKQQRILELYQECLAFYSAEEKRHADEFFQLLRKVGGQPTPRKPPDPLTSMVLKIFSLGTPLDNLAALHVTELISCEFYSG